MAADSPLLSPLEGAILGMVEGLTEFLPVSSTGHLIIVSEWMGLRTRSADPQALAALQAYEIVIQAGAILAVLWIYRESVIKMLRGLVGQDSEGRELLIRIIAAFMPTVVLGLSLKGLVRTYLQHTAPVIAALVIGGVFMIALTRYRRHKGIVDQGMELKDLTVRQAVLIGIGQSAALWPGMSRSMSTISSGLLVGLNPRAATEFSFLLGLPTLLAATAYQSLKEGHLILDYLGLEASLCGLLSSAVFGFLTVRWMLKYLRTAGLEIFGWYRIGLAIVAYLALKGP